MTNETILDYTAVTEVTQHPLIVLTLLTIWLFPLLVYIIIGFMRKARTKDGRIISGTRMIQTLNFWIGFSIWFFLQGGLLITLLIYPLWLNLI